MKELTRSRMRGNILAVLHWQWKGISLAGGNSSAPSAAASHVADGHANWLWAFAQNLLATRMECFGVSKAFLPRRERTPFGMQMRSFRAVKGVLLRRAENPVMLPAGDRGENAAPQPCRCMGGTVAYAQAHDDVNARLWWFQQRPPRARTRLCGSLLRQECLPSLVVVEDPDLCYLALRFVNIFYNGNPFVLCR